MSELPSLGPRGEGWVAIQLVLLSLIAIGALVFGQAWAGLVTDIGCVIGVALIVAGVVMLVAGSLKLRGQLTALPRPREDAAFVQDGICARVRHPLYGGLVLA